MITIENRVYPNERSLYNSNNLKLIGCKFQGIEDGESALKECTNILIDKCLFDLRYPIWHTDYLNMKDSTLTENCRAAMWYSNHLQIGNSELLGIKAVRECCDVSIFNSKICSPEFGWKSKKIILDNVDIDSVYFMFDSKDITINKMNFKGKYSFQYVSNLKIINSNLDTKDAFWHANNVVVQNCVVKGEYLGWYSNNITFIDCTIIGTQPLCYCVNLELINCKMQKTDLAFEYSDVDASIVGTIDSVKNPKSGKIRVDHIDDLIITDDSKYQSSCVIEQKHASKQ